MQQRLDEALVNIEQQRLILEQQQVQIEAFTAKQNADESRIEEMRLGIEQMHAQKTDVAGHMLESDRLDHERTMIEGESEGTESESSGAKRSKKEKDSAAAPPIVIVDAKGGNTGMSATIKRENGQIVGIDFTPNAE